ncbi:MAG: NAD(P)-dependent oxidoreductase [Betaproteobacteria bacterium]|nr:MAG: NAD(P)-dependent oxidoreductase [Betaproteobacteria bacterium]
MRILITGGGGFLGNAVANALVARGDTAVAFDTHFSLDGAPESDHHIRLGGDITDMAALAQVVRKHRPEVVIHCAAIVGVLSSIGSPINIVRINVEGSINVFEAMRLGDIKRCIHISSEEAYGEFRSHRMDESHPLEPVLPYGICKATVEQLGRTYRDLHGLEVINLRTSWVYGPGLPRDRIPRNMVLAALEGRALHIAHGAQSAIDHTYVDDWVTAVLAALDHAEHRYDVYNVSSGHSCTVKELAEIVTELVPGAEISVGPGMYRHGNQIELVRKGALDISRADAELGWKPRFDIRSGLAAYIKALREAKTQN